MFTRSASNHRVLDSLRYLIADRLKVYAYVILGNHVHLVVQTEPWGTDMTGMHSHAGAWERGDEVMSVGTR